MEDTVAVVVNEHEQSIAKTQKVRWSDAAPPNDLITPPDSQQHERGHVRASSGSFSQLRRTSLPPIDTEPTESRAARHASLPAAIEKITEGTALIQEIQFTPLRALVSERQRRRLRRSGLSEEMNHIEEHDREDARRRKEIVQLRRQLKEHTEREKALQWEVEQLRLERIEVFGDNAEEELAVKEKEKEAKIQQMENELRSLRETILHQKEQAGFPDTDTDSHPGIDVDMHDAMSDDDDLELVAPADLGITEEDMAVEPYTNDIIDLNREQDITYPSIPDPTHEAEVRNFEQAIATLTREAADAKATLKIISIELQSLGFADENASNDQILSSIRNAFRQARIELEELLPHELPNYYRNPAFLNLLIENIRRLLNKVTEQTTLIQRHREMEAILNSQNKGLLDKLAEVDHRKQVLEAQWVELDKQADRKEKRLLEYKDAIEEWQVELEARDALLEERDEQVASLMDELDEKTASNERLQQALNGYRDEVSSLENLITRMDEEHKATIAHMEEVHNATVTELEEKLETEKSHRETAEHELDEKTAFISELQVKIESAENKLDELRDQLLQSQEYGEAERRKREEAEAELDDKTSDIANLESRIEAAETNLEALHNELASTQALLDSERRQRTAAENEMDERGEKIAALDKQLHDAGIRANELRQKLFEVQQQRDKEINQLQQAAAEREEQFQDDMAAEIERREAAQHTATDRNAVIADLEDKIRSLNQAMDELVEAKDALIAEQKAQIADLEETLAEANEDYNRLAKDKEEVIKALQEDIAALNNLANERAVLIDELHQQVDESSRKNEELARANDTLSKNLADAVDNVKSLEAAKLSLEKRVEEEAEQMLVVQEDNARAVAQVQSDVKHRDKRIKTLENDAVARKEEYEAAVSQRDEEIRTLQIALDARAVDIASLSAQVADLKKKYKAQVEEGKKTVEAITAPFREALKQAEKHGRAFGEASDRSAMEVEGMSDDMKVTALATSKVGKVNERVKVLRKSGKKRKFDSGFGVASDEEDEMEMVGV